MSLSYIASVETMVSDNRNELCFNVDHESL